MVDRRDQTVAAHEQDVPHDGQDDHQGKQGHVDQEGLSHVEDVEPSAYAYPYHCGPSKASQSLEKVMTPKAASVTTPNT